MGKQFFETAESALEYRDLLLASDEADPHVATGIVRKLAESTSDEEWVAIMVHGQDFPSLKLSKPEMSYLSGGASASTSKSTLNDRAKNSLIGRAIVNETMTRRDVMGRGRAPELLKIKGFCGDLKPGLDMKGSTWVSTAESICRGFSFPMKK